LSLLEVMLALTILAVALTALGELIAIGTRSAATARDTTRAQFLCQSKIAELTTTYLPITPQQQVDFETDPDWVYSIDVQQLDTGGLLAVTVTVQQRVDSARRPVTCSLTQWIPDPQVEWPETFEELYEIESESGSGE
jgi:Tfp pilus assembly protein PilV